MSYRPKKTLENSESQEKDLPRLLIAAQYMELDGYLWTRFRIQNFWLHLLANERPGNTGNKIRHGEEQRREPQSSTIPTSRFVRDGICVDLRRVNLHRVPKVLCVLERSSERQVK